MPIYDTDPQTFHSSLVWYHASEHALRIISLESNSFGGKLEDHFNETILENLLVLSLNDNQFTGAIPPSLQYLDSARLVNLSSNFFEGPVPNGICNLRGPTSSLFLEADCGGDPVANECNCCTSCCDRISNICQEVNPDERNRQLVQEDNDTAGNLDSTPDIKRQLQRNECLAQFWWNSESGHVEQSVKEAI